MAALKDREIEARGAGKIVSRADELALLTKMLKSRQELAAIYAEAGRAELAAQENAEIAVIGEFLPKQMDDGAVLVGREGGDRCDGRGRPQGHGQSGQRSQSRPSRPDGLRQGERDRQGLAHGLTAGKPPAAYPSTVAMRRLLVAPGVPNGTPATTMMRSPSPAKPSI